MATDTDNKTGLQPAKPNDNAPKSHVVRIVPIGEDDPAAVTQKDRFLISTIVVLLMILAALAITGFLIIKPEPDVVQGQGEADEIRISGKLPGRVARIYVEEGQTVHQGDTIVHITSTLVDAQYDHAQALEEVASAGQAKVDEGTRPQIIQAAKDVWDQAKATEAIAKKTYDRMEALCAKGVVSAQRRDEAKAALDVAKAGANAAKSSYDLARAGAQNSEKQAASAMVRAAQGSKKSVTALLQDQYLTAPFDGEIISIYPKVSELIATGAPIATLQLKDRWAVFNVRETFLKDLKVGSIIETYIPALDLTKDMEVFYIKDLGTYANWQATKATGDYDARTFSIKARPLEPIENFRPGMSVVYKKVKSTDSKKEKNK